MFTCCRYLRAKSLPPNPRIDEPLFDVHVAFFPSDFHQGAVFAGTATNRARHLLFFTPVFKRQLEDCTTWFIDATFHFIRDPIKKVNYILIFQRKLNLLFYFIQFLFINSFIKNEKGDLEQVPLLFCCMTRKRAIDYLSVFQKLKVHCNLYNIYFENLFTNPFFTFLQEVMPLPRVQRIVTDFKRAIFWQSVRCFRIATTSHVIFIGLKQL